METADVLKALLGFALGVASAWIGLYTKVRQELAAQYDRDLRAERQKAYVVLWAELEPLAKYARPAAVTGDSLAALAAKLRQWYFHTGGLLLSAATRERYFALQETIADAVALHASAPQRELKAAEFERVRQAGSRLRTAMTADVGSRREPLLAGEAAG